MEIAEALSFQRLEAYRQSPSENEQQILPRYLRNVLLSEALYPVLHFLEVSLRNHTHAIIAEGVSDQGWLAKARCLESREAALVRKAIETLARQDKELNSGNLIAELNFGFWTSLFDVRYERVFWQRSIKHLFPEIPRTHRTRHTVSARLNRIRRLRNRVFHYEPIWHWKDLPEQHAAILETIGWMSPATAQTALAIDRFSAVFGGNTLVI
jgi:hypothetical protein